MPPDTQAAQPTSFAGVFLRGAAWMVSMRWMIRLLGLVSTAILARVLVPEDFGLVAMAVVVAGLANTLVNFGAEYAIIRDKSAGKDDFDTAWTLRIAQSAGVALLVFATSGIVADFYGDQRLSAIVWVTAIGILIAGFQNIGVALFQKDFNFLRDFQFHVLNKLVSITITIILALILRNYWALVFGHVINALSAVIFSYILSNYRPRFTFVRLRSIFGFSQWILITGFANFVNMNGDKGIFGKLFSAADLGIYSIAKEIAVMVTSELTMPITRALVPTMAQLTDDMDRFRAAFLSTIGGAMTLALPAAAGLIIVAPQLIPVLLGPQWDDVVPFLQALTLAGLFQVYLGLCVNGLLILKHGRIVAAASWIQAIIIFVAIIIGYERFGMMVAPFALIFATGATAIINSIIMTKFRAMSFTGLFNCLWRSVTACVVMVAVNHFATLGLQSDVNNFVLLMVKVGLGTLSYSIALVALWILSGRPNSIEGRIIDKLMDIIRTRAIS